MPYFNDLHTYLHQSSLLIQAYPSTRITTKYSLPRKPNPKAKSQTKAGSKPAPAPAPANADGVPAGPTKRDPAATLTLKTFHPDSGICLKYRTDKAAEVGRLITGLGRLAKGEIVEMPTIALQVAGDKMDIDEGPGMPAVEENVVSAPPPPAAAGGAGGGGGGGGAKGKKKKGGKK